MTFDKIILTKDLLYSNIYEQNVWSSIQYYISEYKNIKTKKNYKTWKSKVFCIEEKTSLPTPYIQVIVQNIVDKSIPCENSIIS